MTFKITVVDLGKGKGTILKIKPRNKDNHARKL